jgi:1-acylglycerone phosphate reductase
MAQQAMAEKSVLVTGASNGQIGAALVVAFQQKGFTVFAAVRDPDTATDLSKLPRVHILNVDLTSEASIAEAVESVQDHTSGRGLEVLMNSARVEFVMPLVDSSIFEGKRLFDINIWGTFAMIKAFTPQLIQNKGTVVNMSSIGGLVNTPWLGKYSKPVVSAKNLIFFIGLYAASESALNTMGETLRLELAPFHVRVLTVVTGCVQADIYKKPGEFQLPPKSIYSRIISTLTDTAEGKLDPEMMPAEIYASRVVADVLKGRTGLVYRGNVATMIRIISWLPPILLVSSALRLVPMANII